MTIAASGGRGVAEFVTIPASGMGGGGVAEFVSDNYRKWGRGAAEFVMITASGGWV